MRYGLGRNVSTKDFRDYPLGDYIRGVSDITEKMWPFTVLSYRQKMIMAVLHLFQV